MKKLLSIIIVAATISILSFSSTAKKAVAEKTVSKTINMAVFTNSDYNTKIYDASSVGLSVTVTKANGKKTETVWAKSFPSLALKFFPAAVNAFKEAIKIPNVLTKDVLQVSYTLTYNSNGSTMQMQGDGVVSGTETNGNIEINI